MYREQLPAPALASPQQQAPRLGQQQQHGSYEAFKQDPIAVCGIRRWLVPGHA
jgi:hypothetical protein